MKKGLVNGTGRVLRDVDDVSVPCRACACLRVLGLHYPALTIPDSHSLLTSGIVYARVVGRHNAPSDNLSAGKRVMPESTYHCTNMTTLLLDTGCLYYAVLERRARTYRQIPPPCPSSRENQPALISAASTGLLQV